MQERKLGNSGHRIPPERVQNILDYKIRVYQDAVLKREKNIMKSGAIE